MPSTIAQEAAIPNPRLAAFAPLIGTWTTEGRHPMVPGTTLHGRATFEWLDGGAFVRMRAAIDDDPRFPAGIAIFGSDDEAGSYTMLYFDQRLISRRYELTVDSGVLRWQRMSKTLSQRYALTVSADGNSLHSVGEMSRDGGAWGPDLELTYTRVK
jgi:hypothetical protein